MELISEYLKELQGNRDIKFEQKQGEKRKAMRLPMGRKALVARKSGNANCVVREVSATGLSLMSPSAIKVGEEFIVLLPRLDGTPLPVKCRAVRCEHGGAASSIFIVGAAFTQVLNSRETPSPEQFLAGEWDEVMRIRQAMFSSNAA